jgi:retron-type reverse transcriptase
MAAIINKTIVHSTLPAEWKEARACPIPKKDQSSDPIDYRPVSILPAVSLIAEKHMMRFLGPVVENGLPECQYGFRTGRGCEDALIRLESEICAGWEKCRLQKPRVATKVAVVAIDMSKAFDKVLHCQLMRSLRQRFQLPPCVDRWYCYFLTGRTM